MTNSAVWDLQSAQTIATLTMASGNSITNAAGSSSLAVSGQATLANSIATANFQIYSGTVTLLADLTLTAGTDIAFKDTVNGAYGLSATVGSTGKLIFNYAVGGITPLSSINVAASGTTYINADISTTGDQTYANTLNIGVAGVEQFSNGDFSSGLDNWSYSNISVYMGTTVIGGFTSPSDSNYPTGQSVNTNTTGYVGTFPASNRSTSASGGYVTMSTGTGSCTTGYCVVRGPFLISNGTVNLAGGDTVSFRWTAVAGGDAYDAFGYLLNVTTGATQQILNSTGASTSAGTSWSTSTYTLPGGASAADYKFVFVAGSFDSNGARGVGGSLSIDDVATTSASANMFVGTPDTNVKLTAGKVIISGATNLSTNTLEVSNSTNGSIVSGIMSGTGNFIKSGNASLTLSGANTYAGTTTVSAGTLKLGHATALGTVAAGTTVASGAVLDLNGQNISNAEALTISGDGISAGGALINTSSTSATYAGLVTLGANASIVGDTGAINLSNAGTMTGTYDLILGGAQGGSITSIVGISTGSLT